MDTNGWDIQWCCAGASSSLGVGCQQVAMYDHSCLGVCWICKEGWTNMDGTIGCVGGTEPPVCPK